MVTLIALIMMIWIIMITIMILPMMMNTEKLEVLEHYLKSLIEIITNKNEPMLVLQEEIIITQNIRVKLINIKTYHLKNILM